MTRADGIEHRLCGLAPALHGAVVSLAGSVCIMVAQAEDAHAIGELLVSSVAVVQTLVVSLVAVPLGAISRSGEAQTAHPLLSVLRTAAAVLFLLSASLPVAVAGWLAGGWDLTALVGLYASHALMAAALALLGMGIAGRFSWGAVRVVMVVATVVCLLSLMSTRDRSDALPAPESRLAFLSPGHGSVLFFRGRSSGETGPRPGEWAKHFAALAVLGGLGAGMALRRRPLR
jgi:hypothetical protein